MLDYDKIIQLTSSEEVKKGYELPKIQLHKWLVLGQTRYLCENGTLSDGHDKFTDAQKYAQALKEYYFLALNIKTQRAQAKIAMADYIEAEEAIKTSSSPATRLRYEGKKEIAETQLASCLTTVEDQMRMLHFYIEKCNELGPKVEQQYPNGIEQAEMDNWIAVAKYRNIVKDPQGMKNLPLPVEVKAQLGISMDRLDMIAPLMIEKENDIRKLPTGSVNEYLGLELAKEKVQ